MPLKLDEDTLVVMVTVATIATGPMKSRTGESIPLTQAKHSTPLSQELPARGGAAEVCRLVT
jgi:hypothetical protein